MIRLRRDNRDRQHRPIIDERDFEALDQHGQHQGRFRQGELRPE
jgi:hypothetical protein